MCCWIVTVIGYKNSDIFHLLALKHTPKKLKYFCFQKLTGQKLVYSAFLGKPYLTSYQYAEYCLNQNSGGASGNLRTLYAVGSVQMYMHHGVT